MKAEFKTNSNFNELNIAPEGSLFSYNELCNWAYGAESVGKSNFEISVRTPIGESGAYAVISPVTLHVQIVWDSENESHIHLAMVKPDADLDIFFDVNVYSHQRVFITLTEFNDYRPKAEVQEVYSINTFTDLMELINNVERDNLGYYKINDTAALWISKDLVEVRFMFDSSMSGKYVSVQNVIFPKDDKYVHIHTVNWAGICDYEYYTRTSYKTLLDGKLNPAAHVIACLAMEKYRKDCTNERR